MPRSAAATASLTDDSVHRLTAAATCRDRGESRDQVGVVLRHTPGAVVAHQLANIVDCVAATTARQAGVDVVHRLDERGRGRVGARGGASAGQRCGRRCRCRSAAGSGRAGRRTTRTTRRSAARGCASAPARVHPHACTARSACRRPRPGSTLMYWLVTATATIGGAGRAAPNVSRVAPAIAVHISCGSCSAPPPAMNRVATGRLAHATVAPSAETSATFGPPVPRSMASTHSDATRRGYDVLHRWL